MRERDHEAAIALLEAAFEVRSDWFLPFLGVHPHYDPLRDDPRFRALLERHGIPRPAHDGESR